MANTIEILIRAKDDATRALQSASASAKGLAASTAGISFGAIAAGAAAFGAELAAITQAAGTAAAAVADFAEKAEQLQNKSLRTGIGVDQFQVLEQAAKNANVPTELLTQAMRQLNNAIASGDPKLKALGINAKDSWTALGQLADVIGATDNAQARLAISTGVLGARFGDQLIPVLIGGAAGLKAVEDQMRSTQTLIEGPAVRAAAMLDDQIDRLNQRVAGFKNQLLVALVPALGATIGALLEVANRAQLAAAILQNLAAGFEALGKHHFGAAAALFKNATDIYANHTAILKQARAAQDELFSSTGNAAPVVDGVNAKVAAYLALLAKLSADSKKAAKDVETLAEALAKAGLMADSVKDKLSVVTPATTSDAKPKLGLGTPALPQPVEPGKEATEALTRTGDRVREELRNIRTVTDDLLASIQSGLRQGFQTVFQGILAGAQTFGGALKSIFASIVSEILNMLAKLAAASVFKLFLNLVTGGAARAGKTLGVAMTGFLAATEVGPVGRTSGSGTGGRSVDRGAAPAGAVGAPVGTSAPVATLTRDDLVAAFKEAMQATGIRMGGDTFNISALDTRSAYDALVSPGGGLRRANDRLGEIAAVA